MHEITYIGEDELYQGYDGDRAVLLLQGESADVSDEKAAQLARDRHSDFLIDGQAPEPPPVDDDDDEEEEEDPREALMALTSPELNEAAAAAGVEKPEELPNKDAVVDAILALGAGGGGGDE